MKITRRQKNARGFTLLELLVALGMMAVVLGMVASLTKQLVQTNSNVSNNVDMTQQARQFMDQISLDIHQAGYPSYKLFDQSISLAVPAYYYAGTPTTTSGVISASSTALQFEGDVDHSGTVSEVFLQLCVTGTSGATCTVPTSNSQCPCTMQRGTIAKQTYTGGAQPNYYTELTGVMNTDVFDYWDYGGTQVWVSNPTGSDISNIRTVKIRLNLQTQYQDAATGNYLTTTMESEAKLSN